MDTNSVLQNTSDAATLSAASAAPPFDCVFPRMDFRMDNNDLVQLSNVALSVLNGCFALTAITGNFLVLLAIWLTPLKNSPSFLLISALAFADLQVGLVVQPAFMAYKISEIYGHGSVACYARFVKVLFGYATTGVSLVTMTAIGLERYLALRLHLRYVELITRKKILLYCVISWLAAFSVAATYFIERRVFGAIVVLAEILSVVITSVAYFRVYKIFKRHHTDIQRLRRVSVEPSSPAMQLNIRKYRRSTTAMFLVFTLSFIFYAPYPVVSVLLLKRGFTPANKVALESTATLICVNSSVNPLIYCLKLKEIRRAVLKIFTVQGSGVHPSDRSLAGTFAPVSTVRKLYEGTTQLDKENQSSRKRKAQDCLQQTTTV